MNNPRKKTHRKSLQSSTSSSENDLWQQIERPLHRASQSSTSSSSGSATGRPIYPNVPKRTQRISSINEHELIQTDSQISVLPSEKQSQKPNGYSSVTPSTNQNAQTLRNLSLITKYTSPHNKSQHSQHRSSSPTESQSSLPTTDESPNGSKCKRTLSPLYEANRQSSQSKRSKTSDENNDDDDELCELLDYRRSKQNLSQSTIDDQDMKSTARKATVRKLSTTLQRSTVSYSQPSVNSARESFEPLIIEPDIDTEEDMTMDQGGTSWLHRCSQMSNEEHKSHSKLEYLLSQPKSTIEHRIDPIQSTVQQTPVKDRSSRHIPFNSTSKQAVDNSAPDILSPCFNVGDRRTSLTSLNSLSFETPRSSLSRTTTSQTISTPPTIIKHNRDTQMSIPSNIEMLNQLITQMNLNTNHHQTPIDYNPSEVAKKFFYQCNSYAMNKKYHTMHSLIKKQFLNVGRYEIEVLYPMNNDQSSTIYACDICLKHFHGSLIAFQRHTSKCLSTQPPGKLIFNEDDLAIFQIGETKLNIEQRIYIQSLCRITRLFMDPNRSIDDRKIDRFAYYILCRRDPILSQTQSSIYRFIGYFSKQLNQHAQQSVNTLSCLSILPPFAHNQTYTQLLIAFSYFLIRSNTSTNLIYTSPARPLDNRTLSSLRIYWRDTIFACLNNLNSSSMKTMTLETLARQTSIHPRDILSSLYSTHAIVAHPTDKSSIYLRQNAYHSMTSLNLSIRNKLLFMIVTDNEQKITIDKQNMNNNHASDAGEIVLD